MTDDKQTENSLRVLVTAGASGIGRVLAEKFAKAGRRVHICDLYVMALR